MGMDAGMGPVNVVEGALSTAGSRKLDNLAAGMQSGAQDKAALQTAAREFEAVFLGQLMKAMRATVPDNELFNSKGPTKFYQQMYDAELARGMASGPAKLGIADLIVRQLERSGSGAVDVAPDAPAGQPVPVQWPAAQPAPVQSPAGLPAPVQSPAGPPAPAQSPARAVDRYRNFSVIGRDQARNLRLRSLAEARGDAVADTLRRFEPEIHRAAAAEGLDPALVLAVVMVESGGDPSARSAKGATGLMQLMPGTAGDMGVADPAHPGQNLEGGSRYLARMLERYDQDLELALAAYNAGPGRVDRAGKAVPDIPETRRYIQKVLDHYQSLGGGTNLDGAGP